ncbi:MAG TPA: glycosyltransferase family 39 protein [Thermoleophilaceae bacterium]
MRRAAAAWLRSRPRVATAGAVALLAVAIWAVYGAGYVGYDQLYALMWGDDLAEGRLPGYEAPRAPTPHPLANLAGLALAPLGDGSLVAARAIALVAFAGLAVAAYALAARLFSPAVGVLFAALLLTRPSLVNQAQIASVDVPFLALVLAAAAIEARRPRAGPPVLAVLGLAGLLRPEAWLLAAAYAAHLLRRASPRDRLRIAALAAAAPLAWLGSDLLVAGDPLWSLHRTREAADRLGDEGGPVATLEWAVRSWKGLLHVLPAVLSAAGAVLAARLLGRRAAIPLALLGLGVASSLAVGLAGVPLLTRYFFLPATVLCLLAAVAVLGWRELPAGRRARRPWKVAGAAAGLALLASAPYELDQVHGALLKTSRGHEVQRDLQSIARRPGVRDLIPRCQPLQTRLFRARPLLLWARRDDPPARIVATRRLDLGAGMLLVYSREERPPPAPGFATVARNRSWEVRARCGGATASRAAPVRARPSAPRRAATPSAPRTGPGPGSRGRSSRTG